MPEHFFSGGATSERGFPDLQAGPRDTTTGFPLGGTALLMNQTELRFPLLGENIGGVLFHDMGNVYTSPSSISFRTDQHGLSDFDYMNHAVGFGIRYKTPIGPVRLDLAYSINPPRFIGFSGSFSDLLNSGQYPCQTLPGRLRGTEHQPFSILLFHRADILMRRRLSIAILLAAAMPAAAEIIDRIAVSVGNRVITETDLDREIRITAFLNHSPAQSLASLSPIEKRTAAERMVDQALIRSELEASRYPPPSMDDTEIALHEERARYGNDAAYRKALADYGIDEADLKARLQWQLTLVRFIDIRFRPGVQVSDEEIRKYFDEELKPALLRAHPDQTPSLDEHRAEIEQTLTGQAADQQVEQWLKEARRRTHIQYHDEVFQ